MKIETGSENRLNSQQVSELAQSLLASPEVAARAALLADAMRSALPGSACALYAFGRAQKGLSLSPWAYPTRSRWKNPPSRPMRHSSLR